MERVISPRIFRVTYRSRLGRKRKVTFYVKVPYSGLFSMNETLARAVSTRQVMWFRLDVPEFIHPNSREALARWPAAFAVSSEITGVDWNA